MVCLWSKLKCGQIWEKYLNAGDVVGWGGNGISGHLAIFDGKVFIYSSGPGKAVKTSTTLNH